MFLCQFPRNQSNYFKVGCYKSYVRLTFSQNCRDPFGKNKSKIGANGRDILMDDKLLEKLINPFWMLHETDLYFLSSL